ncbi:MAG: ATP-binding protein [Gallionella sp.]
MYHFKNFKNFADAHLDLFQSVTLMIGKNGAGKSNAIEAIELLAQIARGRPLHEIVDVGRGSGGLFEIRGGLEGCLTYQAGEASPVGEFELGFEATFDLDGKSRTISYSIAISSFDAKVFKESLMVDEQLVFDATSNPSNPDELFFCAYGEFESHLPQPSDRTGLFFYDLLANKDISPHYPTIASDLVEYLRAVFVFDPTPRLMREYQRMGQSVLQKNGANLSSVLYALKQANPEKQATLARILDLIRQLPDEPFTDFDFVETRVRDVLLGLKREDGTITDARALSDGTLRALAILTALETVPEQARVVIEELDNGIHPSRIKMLVDAIWECSTRRNLNVLVTTHNPATLDSLDAEQLQSVVLCYWDVESRSSKFMPLLELPRVESLLEQGRLGDLVTRRVVEKHLLPDFEENQQHKIAQWLESLA